MIRLTPQRRPSIPNRVALIAALALALVTYAGYLSNPDSASGQSVSETVVSAGSDKHAGNHPAETKRKLSISLLLFGRG